MCVPANRNNFKSEGGRGGMCGHKYLGDERVPVFAVGQSKSNVELQMMLFETKHKKLVYTVRAELPQKERS